MGPALDRRTQSGARRLMKNWPVLQGVQTPYFVVDEEILDTNLQILKYVMDESGAKILLAQKAFSVYQCYPQIREVLCGSTASGLLKRASAMRRWAERPTFSVRRIRIGGSTSFWTMPTTSCSTASPSGSFQGPRPRQRQKLRPAHQSDAFYPGPRHLRSLRGRKPLRHSR